MGLIFGGTNEVQAEVHHESFSIFKDGYEIYLGWEELPLLINLIEKVRSFYESEPNSRPLSSNIQEGQEVLH